MPGTDIVTALRNRLDTFRFLNADYRRSEVESQQIFSVNYIGLRGNSRDMLGIQRKTVEKRFAPRLSESTIVVDSVVISLSSMAAHPVTTSKLATVRRCMDC